MKYVAITITALGLVLGACGKKDTPPADPTPAEPAKVDEAKTDQAKVDEAKVDEAKVDEAKADEAKVDEAKVDEAKVDEAKADEAKADTDRAAEFLKGFTLFNEGKLDEAFANLTDDVVCNEVGDPMMPVTNGKEAHLAQHRAVLEGFPDMKVHPRRVFDAGEWVIAEVVITGTHSKTFQGMEPTNKPFGVAAAMAYHYNEAGKVDRIDSFFDAATMLMQIGAVPAPAEMPGMKPVAVPEGEVEIVKGEANEDNVALINQWNDAFGQEGLQDAIDKYWADDFTYHGYNEGMETVGKEANKKSLEEHMFSMFPDWKSKSESTVSVGDYVIAWSTSTGTYKGGMPGVESTDQAITSHSLDISKIVDGKLAEFTYYSNGLEFMAQLGMMGGAGGDKGADADEPGAMDEAADAVKEAADEVDEALDAADDAMKAADDAMKAAGQAMPQEAKDAMKAGMDEAKKAMDEAADDMDEAADEMKKAADEMNDDE